MKQSVRSALPRPRWRGASLGSLLAVLVVALGLVLAPAAAAPASPAPPDLGSVRQLAVDVDVTGTAPRGLDLSGAGIRFASTTTATIGTCVTLGLGRCDVRWTSGTVSGDGTSALRLPTGTYTVTQVAERAVPGLRPAVGTLATVTICDCWHTVLRIKVAERSGRLDVPNASLYRHTITARVVDQGTGAPVRDARYRLTGPGFPGLLGDVAVVDLGVERSNRQGELSFSLLRTHVLRPGTWTLTPVGVPAPYLADPRAVELTAGAPGGNTWALDPIALSVPVVPEPLRTGSATLTVQPAGPVPPGWDLSGATFELVGSGIEPATGRCVTDASGSCAIEVVPAEDAGALPAAGAALVLPEGSYEVRQTTAPAGLTAAAEIAPLELCVSGTPEECATARDVPNSTLFRSGAEVTLLSADGPVPGTGITLTREGSAPAARTTDGNGRAEWSGWFLPGEWRFDVAGRSEPFVMTMAPPQGDSTLPWRVDLTLPPLGQPGGTGTAGTPTTTPEPTVPAPPTSSAPVLPSPLPSPAPTAPAGTGSVPGGARVDAGTTALDDGEPTAEAPAIAPAPTPTPTTASPAAADGEEQVFVAAGAPELQTESSVDLLTAGLVAGIGIFFVALVLTGYGVLRSRARRRV